MCVNDWFYIIFYKENATMASKAMQWAATIALGLAFMGSVKGVDDSQTINITRDNNTPKAVEGKMASADNPISRELKINTEGVIDKTPVITTDRGPGWVIKEGGKGYPNVTVGNTPKENGSAMAPGPYHLDVKGVSRLIGGEGTGNPTYEWTALENYRMVKAYIVKVPRYLYANATYLVPVTVAFVGLPEIRPSESGESNILYFTDEKTRTERSVKLKGITAKCETNTTNICWDNPEDCQYLEWKPGTSQVTFWMLPPSAPDVKKHFEFISNKKVKWTIKAEISDDNSPIEISGESYPPDGFSWYMLSPEINVLEIGDQQIKSANPDELFHCSQGKKKFIYLASKDDQYLTVGKEGNFSGLTLKHEYEWEEETFAKLLQRLDIDPAFCITWSYKKSLHAHASILGGEVWENGETIELVGCKPTVSTTYAISYAAKELPGGLSGMDLEMGFEGGLRFEGGVIAITTDQKVRYEPVIASTMGTLASAAAGAGIAVLAGGDIATVGIASPLLGASIHILNLIKDISAKALEAYAGEYLKPEKSQGPFLDAYSNIDASVTALRITASKNPMSDSNKVLTDNKASTLMVGKYQNVNSQIIEMHGSPTVHVGETIWIEASCSAKVYITTHFWDWAYAQSDFKMADPEDVLRSFVIQ